MARMVQYIK